MASPMLALAEAAPACTSGSWSIASLAGPLVLLSMGLLLLARGQNLLRYALVGTGLLVGTAAGFAVISLIPALQQAAQIAPWHGALGGAAVGGVLCLIAHRMLVAGICGMVCATAATALAVWLTPTSAAAAGPAAAQLNSTDPVVPARTAASTKGGVPAEAIAALLSSGSTVHRGDARTLPSDINSPSALELLLRTRSVQGVDGTDAQALAQQLGQSTSADATNVASLMKELASTSDGQLLGHLGGPIPGLASAIDVKQLDNLPPIAREAAQAARERGRGLFQRVRSWTETLPGSAHAMLLLAAGIGWLVGLALGVLSKSTGSALAIAAISSTCLMFGFVLLVPMLPRMCWLIATMDTLPLPMWLGIWASGTGVIAITRWWTSRGAARRPASAQLATT